MPNRLQIDDLAVARLGRPIIAGLSLHADAGHAVLLRGPNGAGKTTLLKAIAGLLSYAAGTISLESTGAADPDASVGERSHIVGHANGLKPQLTVRENLQFWCRYLGGDAELVPVAMQAFALDELSNIPTALLSAGQKRRAGLARLLVATRPLWLLDEPTTSLDTASVALVERAITRHQADGGIALIATHLDLSLDDASVFQLAPLSLADAEAGAFLESDWLGADQ